MSASGRYLTSDRCSQLTDPVVRQYHLESDRGVAVSHVNSVRKRAVLYLISDFTYRTHPSANLRDCRIER